MWLCSPASPVPGQWPTKPALTMLAPTPSNTRVVRAMRGIEIVYGSAAGGGGVGRACLRLLAAEVVEFGDPAGIYPAVLLHRPSLERTIGSVGDEQPVAPECVGGAGEVAGDIDDEVAARGCEHVDAPHAAG